MRKIIQAFFILIVMLLSSITVHAIEANNVQVVSNGNTTFMIESNGSVKGWGHNTKGEVGNGTTVDQLSPVAIQGLSNIKEIVPNDYGYGFFFAIDNDNNVYGWGYNGYGQLGIGITTNPSVPTKITGLPEISKIRINEYTVYAITTDGDVYSTGKNDYGQVGNGTKITERTFTKIPQLSNIEDIVCKSNVAYAITNDKRVYAWGRGNSWQIGCGEYIAAQTTPSEITTLCNVDEVVTNGVTTFAICNNRQEIYSWGESWLGEAGNYSEKTATPKEVAIISDLPETIDEFIIVNQTSFALMNDGTLYGWGKNSSNELGNGGTFNKQIPEIIQNTPKVKQFIFNGFAGIALGVDNCVYTWGRNRYGEIGDGGIVYRQAYAEKLTALGENIELMFNGNNAMYAINADGTVYGWGDNSKRQLAIDNAESILPPTIIPNIYDVISIEKTNDMVIASDSQGIIYGWGENTYGQIGNNNSDNVATPFIVSNNEMTITTGTGDVNGTVPVVGQINALTISVTHPAALEYSINPNIGDNGEFIAPDIIIKNNTKVPIRVTVKSLTSTTGGTLQFTDVEESDKDWKNLDLNDSKSYIALGIKINDAVGWNAGYNESIHYAIKSHPTLFGSLSANSSGAMVMQANFGLAFDQSYTAMFSLIFIFNLV